jgi:hypothetical protein
VDAAGAARLAGEQPLNSPAEGKPGGLIMMLSSVSDDGPFDRPGDGFACLPG